MRLESTLNIEGYPGTAVRNTNAVDYEVDTRESHNSTGFGDESIPKSLHDWAAGAFIVVGLMTVLRTDQPSLTRRLSPGVPNFNSGKDAKACAHRHMPWYHILCLGDKLVMCHLPYETSI